ncbi:hypothetical protein SETIT_3G389600v2 [Setaria italica]|uniref:non-specific serine/threonine protein kinase n=1 Tax=Setaria italica TaxID=4555 RepID=A0A368QNU7_SETIT|nr:hypothetical protein SETIT_3G389600v2 [Setaria italica]
MGVLLLLLAASLLNNDQPTAHAVSTSPPSAAAEIAADEQALLSFRALITNDPHGVLASWIAGNGSTAGGNMTTAGACSWRGVGCHSSRHPGRVTSLELSSNLSGTVSPFLSNLTFLSTLNLSHNSFSGNIPEELGFLPRLLYLDLQHNSLQGMIPGSLARASKLRILQLEYNSLVGKIPANLSNLQDLEVLDVGSNQLSGAQQVAIKVIDLQQHGAENSFLAECRVLRSIRHRNLVKVITACSSINHQGNDFKALVYEFMPNGDLDKWLHQGLATQDNVPKTKRRLTMSQRVNIALEVAQALDYLHNHGQVPIVHCDLKPSNVLLDNEMVAHVADFGLARFIRKTASNSIEEISTSIGIKGTIGYIPPEYGMDGNVSIQGDVYSYGVLLLELFTGKRPTDGSFQGGQTLQSYVASCYPDNIKAIVDPALLPLDNGFVGKGDNCCDDIDAEKLQEFMVPIFRIGLQCSQESSRARMHIRSAIRELEAVQDAMLND